MRQASSQVLVLGDFRKKGRIAYFTDRNVLSARSPATVTVGRNSAEITCGPAGIDKVYTGIIGGKLAVSDSIKAFAGAPESAGMAEFTARMGYAPYPLTILEGIRKCPPGITTRVSISPSGKLEYSYHPAQGLRLVSGGRAGKNAGAGMAPGNFRKALDRILKDNFSGSLICSFSGGFDSSMLAAVYRAQCVRYINYSEGMPIAGVALPVETVSHREKFSRADLKRYFSAIDEPCCDKSGFAEIMIAKKAGGSNAPLMNGQGADGLFCNGREFFQESFADRVGRPLRVIPRMPGIIGKLQKYTHGTRQDFLDSYAPAGMLTADERASVDEVYQVYESGIRNDSANKLAALSLMLKYSLHGIEKIRSSARMLNRTYYLPFMSDNVIRLAFSIPSSQKVGFSQGKKMLVRAYPEVTSAGYSSGSFRPLKLRARIAGRKSYCMFFLEGWRAAKKHNTQGGAGRK